MKLEDELEILQKKCDCMIERFEKVIEIRKKIEEALWLVPYIMQNMVYMEKNITNLVLDINRCEEVRDFYNKVTNAIENNEMTCLIEGMIKFAYMDKGVIKIPCDSEELYKLINKKYLEKLHEYSEYQIRFIINEK